MDITAIPKGARTHTLSHLAVCRPSLPSGNDPPLVRHMDRTRWVPRPPKGHGEENGESGKNASHYSERGEGDQVSLLHTLLKSDGAIHPLRCGRLAKRG
jgi:hypothetical protein